MTLLVKGPLVGPRGWAGRAYCGLSGKVAPGCFCDCTSFLKSESSLTSLELLPAAHLLQQAPNEQVSFLLYALQEMAVPGHWTSWGLGHNHRDTSPSPAPAQLARLILGC